MQAWTQVATETIALRIALRNDAWDIKPIWAAEMWKPKQHTTITCQLCKELQSARARYGNFSFTGSETFRGLPFHELITLYFSPSNPYNE